MAKSHTVFPATAALMMAALLAGCGQEPAERIDIRSVEGGPGSQSWVEKSLSPDEQVRFRVALDELSVPYWEVFSSPIVDGWSDRLAEAEAAILAAVDGKTAAEVIRMFEPVVSRRIERERPELDALLERETIALAAQPELEKFTVLGAKLVPGKVAPRLSPRLELRIRNDTPHVVVSAEFRATLATPGRTLPWREDDITEHFSGGVEPGEETKAVVTLESGWDYTRADDAAVMTVAPQALFGPGHTPLYPQMTKRDRERLNQLREIYEP